MSNPYERREKSPQEFSDLQLDQINLQYRDVSESTPDGLVFCGSGEIKLQHQGVIIYLRAEYNEYEKITSKGRMIQQSYNYTIFDAHHEAAITSGFNIKYRSADNLIGTSNAGIYRKDPSLPVPAGIGLELYQKMLNYIGKIAQDDQATITHTVKRATYISTTPMSNERWNELFIPILERNGYQPVSEEEGQWSKVYAPSVSD